MAKKARKGLAGSLGFRVLSISLIFLAIPLIAYGSILYVLDYRQHVRNVYEEMDVRVEEEVAWLYDKQIDNQNILDLIEGFIQSFDLDGNIKSNDQLTDVLSKFISREVISAIAYTEISASGQIICRSSTLKHYVGVDFSKYFTLEQLDSLKDNIFIGEDPIYGYSMYIVKHVKLKDGKMAMLMSIIGLDQLLVKMNRFQNLNKLNISIVSDQGVVIATTSAALKQQTFSMDDKKGTIQFKEISYVDDGLKYTFNGQKSLASIERLPKSTTYLLFTIPEEILMGKFRSFLFKLMILLVLIVVVGGITTYFFMVRLAKPMKQLSNVMTSVGTGHLEKVYTPDKYGFEINHLGESFNQMRVDLLKYIEEVKDERGKKEAFEKELQIGHQIQKAILPSDEAHIDGVEIAAFYIPATEVAGDFYDYLEIEEDKVLLTIADGIGKGISSCLYSFDLRSILKTAALDKGPLDTLVVHANKIFCSDTKDTCNFVTLVTGMLDKKAQTFQFTNAGHLPIMVKRKTGVVELFSTKGIALGIEVFDSVETETVNIEKGEFIVLYTDGITEAFNAEDKLYTEKRLVESIGNFNGETSKELVDFIMDDVNNFVEKSPQHDDITLLVFRLQ